ncbi:hypothetical protein [Cypionkella sp.]|uniref:hypothetical protein n=1 Tax=Cypionkella sp. TaxID=2811411 RepID=UPI00374FFB06
MPKLTWAEGNGVRLPRAVADLAYQIKALLPASLWADVAAETRPDLCRLALVI